MKSTISVIELQPEHKNQLLALYRRYFGAWATGRLAKRWEWQCGAGNPWRSLRPTYGFVAFNNGEAVAGVTLYPVPCRVEGERMIFLCGGDYVVDQSYRVPILTVISRRVMSTPRVMFNGLLVTLRKAALRLGGILFPMSHAHFVMHLRNRGWLCRAARRHVPAVMGRLIAPATTGRLLASRPIEAVLRRLVRGGGPPHVRSLPRAALEADIRPIERFGSDYDRLWGEAHPRFRLTLDKDAEYMNWRYRDCPTFRQPILRGLYRDCTLVAVVVAGAYTVMDGHRRPCGANGEILELIAPAASTTEIQALLLSVCKELDSRGVDMIGALSYGAMCSEALEWVGFQPEEDLRYDTIIVPEKADLKAGRTESTEGVYLTAGDGDALNAFLI